MSSPPSGESQPTATPLLKQAQWSESQLNPTSTSFQPQQTLSEEFQQAWSEDMTFVQGSDFAAGSNFSMQNSVCSSFPYILDHQQLQVVAPPPPAPAPASSLDTFRNGLLMIADSMFQLQTEYESRLQRVERELAETTRAADILRKDFTELTTWTRQLATWAHNFHPNPPVELQDTQGEPREVISGDRGRTTDS